MNDCRTRDRQSTEIDRTFDRALAYHRAGRAAEAIALYTRLLAETPGHAAAWNNLGSALRANGALDAAIVCYKRALEIDPACSATGNLGNALKDAGRIDDALAAHRLAVAAAPDDAATRHNYGIALKCAGDPEGALAEFEAALRLAPNAPGPSWDRALVLLQQGRFAEGWTAYECRFRLDAFPPCCRPGRRWTGEPFGDRTLLVYPEQGFGDCIFASRFLPLVKRRGGTVVLECQPELRRLFSRLAGVDRLVAPGEAVAADLHIPMMSLPGIVDASPDNSPPPPQLHVPAEARKRFATLIARHRDRFTVGIVWSGSVAFKRNHDRSAPLGRFLRLAETPGVQLFSLQTGPRRAEIAEVGGAGTLIFDLGGLVGDFADTAAVIEQLDLVIMTDSAVAHLAGSLSRPIWNVLNRVPYWLYQMERADTPWYPTMRLFRQRRFGDWDGVFAELETALAEAIAAKRAGRWPPSATDRIENR
jgi:tetratricopeptide (TPR) repeat protein